MEIYSCYSGYNYNGHFSTGSLSDPADGTVLHWGPTSRTDLFWLTLIPETDWRRLTSCIVFPFQHRAGNNGNTGLPTVGYHATQQYRSGGRIYGNIRLRLPSNDGLRRSVKRVTIYILSRIPRLCVVVTNNSTWFRIGYRIYSLWRFITTNRLQLQWEQLHTGTGSSFDPTDGTVLRRRLTSRADHFWLSD
jgi:hypothetical protein